MSERFDFTGDELTPAYRAAVDAIEAGDLVVLPTDTVYGLAADAFKADAVQRLLDAKGRGRDMPPPVLISVVESLDALATDVPDDGRKLCEAFWPGPLTVICHAQSSLMWDLGETHGTVALRVPDHENTRELLSRTGPLAVSSANLSGQPAALDVYEAEAQLLDAVAVYLDGGPVYGGEPSTIVDLTGDTPYVVRVGALSIERLREVVPGLGNDDDPAPTDPENPDPENPDPENPDPKKPDLAEADPAFTDPAKADAEKPDAEKPDPAEADPAEADLEKADLEKADPALVEPEEADPAKGDLEEADLEKAAAGRSSGLEPGRDGSADEVLFSEEGAGEGPVVGESSVKPVGLDPEGERSVAEGPAAEVPSAEPLPDLDPEGENAVQERRAADKRAAEDPVAEDPVHEKPAAGSSAARGPAGVDSAVVEPAVVESAPEEPAPVESAPEESVDAESVVVESAPEESVDAESVVVESAREEPAVVKPAREEPAVEEPAFVEPADGSGIDDGPGRKSPAE